MKVKEKINNLNKRLIELIIEDSNKSEIFYTNSKTELENILGIYGIVNYKKLEYLILIAEGIPIGNIYEISKVRIVCLLEPTNKKQQNSDNVFMQNISNFLEKSGIYFSNVNNLIDQGLISKQDENDMQDIEENHISKNNDSKDNNSSSIEEDLTVIDNSQTRILENDNFDQFNNLDNFDNLDNLDISKTTNNFDISKLTNNINSSPLFIFNKIPLMKYHKKFKHFSVKCIQGFVGFKKNIILISKRCPDRAGARYFSRGIDEKGNCSNFVETEIKILTEKSMISYKILRGSIPIKWSHTVGFKYNPKINIIDFKKNPYFDRLKENYKNVKYLSLINHSGYEGYLREKFVESFFKDQKINQNLNDQKINQNLNYKKINQNLNDQKINQNLNDKKINQNLADQNLIEIEYHKNKKIPFEKLEPFLNFESDQKYFLRVNCIDSLDRTNKVQFHIISYMIKKCDFLSEKDKSEALEALIPLFIQNGDYLSKQYSGTGAISCNPGFLDKIQDLYKSINRYFLNRFSHGQLQNTYDLLTKEFSNVKYTNNHLKEKIFCIFLLIFMFKNKAIGLIVVIVLISILYYFSLDYPFEKF